MKMTPNFGNMLKLLTKDYVAKRRKAKRENGNKKVPISGNEIRNFKVIYKEPCLS
jgi:hypothetical protein